MNRILGIELRRSAAIGSALLVLLVGVLLLFFAGDSSFTTGWMQLAMTQRLYLAVLWPLALAAGAWQARREHRSHVEELFASTPRPRGQRTLPTVGAMALAVVCGYLAMGVVGGLWIIGTAGYLPTQAFVVTAVGLLALTGAVWLGLAAGRLLPWLVTAPALAVAGTALILLIPRATRPRGWLALVFSPMHEMNLPGPYTTVPGQVSIAQAVWLTALAVAGVMLFASNGWRARMAALLPVAAGAALAITLMPRENRVVYDAIDPVARELVCTEDAPRVCVSRVHSGLLPEVTPVGRQALALLAKLPDPPAEVHEDTTVWATDSAPPWRRDVALLTVGAGQNGHLANKEKAVADAVSGAFASPLDCEKPARIADRLAATYWLLDREPQADDLYDPNDVAKSVRLWKELRQLPSGKAKTLVAELRHDAVTCTDSAGLSALSR
ncbi:hypothetical protein AB0M36_29170 [Actinoplanes sp. NPDC051346]|uniref:hypothetical protein n=1 Tax=Actinoplanes sp. NPDC051346 TaxID=3155048 RepID=UPI0034432E4A